MSGTTPREVELKLDLGDERAWRRLCDGLSPARSELLQTNRFYDTQTGALGDARLALRLRQEGETYTVTLKGPRSDLGDAATRYELEAPLDAALGREVVSGARGLEQLELAPIAEAGRRVALAGLRLVLSFENLRRTYARTLAGAERLLEVDRTTFGDGSVDHELEVELPADVSADEVGAVASELRELLGEFGIVYRVQASGKFSRALRRQHLS